MKRILFMHQASVIGGGSYCLLNILKAVDRTQIEPVACLVADGPLREEIEKLRIEVVLFPQLQAVPYNRSIWKRSSLIAYWNISRSIPAFKQLLREYHIDVVYLNNMMIYRYLQPAKECGCKTILHCREHWPLDEHKRQLQWARNAVYKYADELIAINHYSASIFPEKKATIVYDWIDFTDRYEPRPMNEIFHEDTSKLKIFLFTGGMQRIKGAYEVVYTFSRVVKDQNSRLLFLGYDINQIVVPKKRDRLRKILTGRGSYESKVRAAIENDNRIISIPATYKLADIIKQSYCMLSYFTIPHANLALAECLVLGTPVIAAATEESIEYSNGDKRATLFNFGDLENFAQCLIRATEKMDYVTGKEDFIEKKFSPNINIQKLNEIIMNICS